MQKDHTLTRDTIISQRHKQLTIQELKELSSNKTVRGDYFYNNEWRLYICYSNEDGTVEGENDLKSFNEGRWSVNDDGGYSVEWDGYWEDWTGFAYHVDGEIMFFDSTTGKWRTTYTKVVEGEEPLEV